MVDPVLVGTVLTTGANVSQILQLPAAGITAAESISGWRGKPTIDQIAGESLESTRNALNRFSNYAHYFPDVAPKCDEFEVEFEKLNDKMQKAFLERQARQTVLRSLIFWRTSGRVRELHTRMTNLQGQIISASANVESRYYRMARKVQTKFIRELDVELLDKYENKDPEVSQREFVATVVKEAASALLTPAGVQMYIEFFLQLLEAKSKDNLESEPQQGSTSSPEEAGPSKTPVTPRNVARSFSIPVQSTSDDPFLSSSERQNTQNIQLNSLQSPVDGKGKEKAPNSRRAYNRQSTGV